MSIPRPFGPGPLRYELDRVRGALALALEHVETAGRMAVEPERGALEYLRSDLAASLKRLGNLQKYPRRDPTTTPGGGRG